MHCGGRQGRSFETCQGMLVSCSKFSTDDGIKLKFNSRSTKLPGCSHYSAVCTTKCQTRMHLRTWQHNMATQHGNNHAAIPMRSAAADFYHKHIDLRTRTRTKHLDGTVTIREQKIIKMPSSSGSSHCARKRECFALRHP
jgi:hypothetical protein